MPINKYECSVCDISEELLQKIAKTDEEDLELLKEAKEKLCPVYNRLKVVGREEETNCELKKVPCSSNFYIKRYANKW